jgi:hypothetical protein
MVGLSRLGGGGIFLCADTLSLQIVSPSSLSCYVPDQFCWSGFKEAAHASVFPAPLCVPFSDTVLLRRSEGTKWSLSGSRLEWAIGYVEKNAKGYNFDFSVRVGVRLSSMTRSYPNLLHVFYVLPGHQAKITLVSLTQQNVLLLLKGTDHVIVDEGILSNQYTKTYIPTHIDPYSPTYSSHRR